jgi:hypothetical protein
VALESLLRDGDLLDQLAERLAARILERLRAGLAAAPESPEGLISAQEVRRRSRACRALGDAAPRSRTSTGSLLQPCLILVLAEH